MRQDGLGGRSPFETHPLVAAEGHHREHVTATGVGRVEGQRVEHVLAVQGVLLGQQHAAPQGQGHHQRQTQEDVRAPHRFR